MLSGKQNDLIPSLQTRIFRRRVVAHVLNYRLAGTFKLEREPGVERLRRLCFNKPQAHICKRFIVRQHFYVADVSLKEIAEIETGAAQTFDDDVVRVLLEHKALVDLPNAMGVTPLMAAAGIGTRTGQSVLGPGPP